MVLIDSEPSHSQSWHLCMSPSSNNVELIVCVINSENVIFSFQFTAELFSFKSVVLILKMQWTMWFIGNKVSNHGNIQNSVSSHSNNMSPNPALISRAVKSGDRDSLSFYWEEKRVTLQYYLSDSLLHIPCGICNSSYNNDVCLWTNRNSFIQKCWWSKRNDGTNRQVYQNRIAEIFRMILVTKVKCIGQYVCIFQW